MKYIYLFILFYSSLTFLVAQDQPKGYDGGWSGVITQEHKEGNLPVKYKFDIVFELKDDKIEGVSFVASGDIFAEMRFTGYLKANRFVYFEELEILNHKKEEDIEWCLKKCHLTIKIKDGETVLEGYWFGDSVIGPCVPGKILLKRPRA